VAKTNIMKNLKHITVLLLIFSLWSCSAQKVVQTNPVKAKKIQVGVFNGQGAGLVSIIETIEALKIDKGITAFEISASDILLGKLNKIDALIFPGGSGSKQLNNLGSIGKKKVEKFLKEDGKGVVGICAGAYMLCSTPSYPSLKIADAIHIREHYDRGKGLIHFKLNEKGADIFPELKNKNVFVQFYDGPVIIPLNNDKSFTELGTYVSDVHINKGTPKGITPNKTFLFTEQIGKGKIFAIAAHTESTPGIRFIVPRMVRWVTNSELVSYDKKWINIEKNNKDIPFTSELKKEERKLWWTLFEDDANVKIQSMNRLYQMRSRNGVRWYMGLLRDVNPKVRALAATLLAKTEYTYAIQQIKDCLQVETDENTKKTIKKALEKLRY
jgi:glutamine amidotransferase PdxT